MPPVGAGSTAHGSDWPYGSPAPPFPYSNAHAPSTASSGSTAPASVALEEVTSVGASVVACGACTRPVRKRPPVSTAMQKPPARQETPASGSGSWFELLHTGIGVA